MRIREEGLWVYGFGEEKTPASFRNACHKFIRTENLRLDNKGDDDILAAEAPHDDAVAGKSTQNDDKEVPKKRFPLKLAAKAVEEASSDDGWANLAAFGSYLNRVQPDFDPRDYGYEKLSALVKARKNIFEIEERVLPTSGKKHLYLRMKTKR
jgi:hypothetical protein